MKIPDFDDIIFERLNKEYGAYLLRKGYKSVVSVSVIAAVISGSIFVLIPFLRVPAEKNKLLYTSIYVTMENMDGPTEQVFVPPGPVPPVTVQAEMVAKFIAPEVKYVAPEVVDSILPFEDKMVLTADSLVGVIPGQENIKGSGNISGVLSGTGGGGDGSGSNGLYSAVEIMPKFRGGDINKFREWVQKKTKYPETATINGIQGKVYVTFIVENDGSVSNGKVVKGVDPLINDEALKSVKSSPKWSPGMNKGKAVRVSYFITVNFEI
ncbi:MAG: energy transducer TonB [Bacteroidetes bacterium]|nr:MAG: energy transducer TonB [Bacteroidota bacterium]